MPEELPVRYYNTRNKPSRFAVGDVIFMYSEDAVKKLMRMVIDTDYGNDNYAAYRLDDWGNPVGKAHVLKSESAKRFHKDELLTNLIARQAQEVKSA